jgi:hypothetical protein
MVCTTQSPTSSSSAVPAASPTDPGNPLGSMYMMAMAPSTATCPQAASCGMNDAKSCSILGPSMSMTIIWLVERNSTG